MNKKYQTSIPCIKNAAKRGFTLIELLVVALIIGILAAVAVPQYRVAVLKSRISGDLLLLRDLKEAQERYYIFNGKYAENFEDLDVSVPSPEKTVSDGGFLGAGWAGETAYYKDYKINIFSGRGFVYGCRRMADGKIIFYGFRLDQSVLWGSRALCAASTGSDIGKQVCKSLGGILFKEEPGLQYYGLPF